MCHLVPGPPPCPEVVAVFYIRPAEVPTLFSVEGDTQVERQNTVVGFLTMGYTLLFIARASILCVYVTVQGLKLSYFVW